MSTQAAAGVQLDWSFGLRNSAGKYLTAETFGNKIACAASMMKKKQIFFLEQPEGSDAVYIKSHLGTYLRIDGDGKFLCDGADAGEESALLIEAQADGRWAIKSAKYGWYCGGAGENLTAFTAEITEDRLWNIHLAMHPQVCIRNVMRKAYMHLDGDALCTDEIIPWGDDATITLTFFPDTGTYGLASCDGRFLTASGALSADPVPEARFILIFQGGVLSFRSQSNGKFLTALGAKGTCKASKAGIGTDEQWILEDSFPQMSFRSPTNSKYISIKQGVEVAATQDGVTDLEIFQIEPVGDKWSIKCTNSKFWTLDGSAIHASAPDASAPESLFGISWEGPRVRIIASNGNTVKRRMNNYLAAVADEDDNSFFIATIVNRPRLVLRGEYGFFGTLPSSLVEGNKSSPETFTLASKDGRYTIQHANGKYLKPGPESLAANSDSPVEYALALHPNSKLTLQVLDGDGAGGAFIETHQNGAIAASGSSAGKSTLFEY